MLFRSGAGLLRRGRLRLGGLCLGRLGEPRYGKRGEQGGGEKECAQQARFGAGGGHDRKTRSRRPRRQPGQRSEEHTSELQSLMRISYAVFCLKKKQKPILTAT